MKVSELFEERYPEPIHFGLQNAANIRKAKNAMREIDIHFDTDSNMGITYFYFKTKKEMKRAIPVVAAEIDKSKEDGEWGSVKEDLTEAKKKVFSAGDKVRLHMPGTPFHGAAGVVSDAEPKDYPAGHVSVKITNGPKGSSGTYKHGSVTKLGE